MRLSTVLAALTLGLSVTVLAAPMQGEAEEQDDGTVIWVPKGGIKGATHQFERMKHKTIQLADMVRDWNGSAETVLPIQAKWDDVRRQVDHTAESLRGGGHLHWYSVWGFKPVIDEMGDALGYSFNTIVDAKPKFDALKLSPIVLGNLKAGKEGARAVNDAFLDQINVLLRLIVSGMANALLDRFDWPIGIYEG